MWLEGVKGLLNWLCVGLTGVKVWLDSVKVWSKRGYGGVRKGQSWARGSESGPKWGLSVVK